MCFANLAAYIYIHSNEVYAFALQVIQGRAVYSSNQQATNAEEYGNSFLAFYSQTLNTPVDEYFLELDPHMSTPC